MSEIPLYSQVGMLVVRIRYLWSGKEPGLTEMVRPYGLEIRSPVCPRHMLLQGPTVGEFLMSEVPL